MVIMRIMVVDDELVSRKKLAYIMNEKGEVDDFSGGFDAIIGYEKALKEGRPYELVLIDVNMPEINGFDTLRKIRGIERHSKNKSFSPCIPVMVSASVDDDTIQQSKDFPCKDFIPKPFEKEVIFKKFDSWFE